MGCSVSLSTRLTVPLEEPVPATGAVPANGHQDCGTASCTAQGGKVLVEDWR